MAKINFDNFEQMLKQLSTTDGKNQAMAMAVKKEIIKDPTHVKKAILHYEETNSYAAAVEIAQKNEHKKTADELYKKGLKYHKKRKEYGAASELARIKKEYKKADKLLEKAIKLHKKRKDFYTASEFEKKRGDYAEADKLLKKGIKYFKKLECYDLAARLAEKRGDKKIAEELRVKANEKKQTTLKFPILLRKISDKTKEMMRKRITKTLGEDPQKIDGLIGLEQAIEIEEKNGNQKRAEALREETIRYCEEKGWFGEAARIASEKGEEEKAKTYKNLADMLK